ncbi:RidA family protein [Conexibacter arvalis]|uniref:Enamine deaminase RidA (YjgF/YER057c/UK114 family) n=1 Tax=Conexibacter arvalis TaxID=912552 RepID=A0A840I8Y4_9ACTN|nr:RidA family protein [Conexibacter arvalis]MBB4660568.1 enamine deaminase RidA (YjgF/YER057c/UK114 family) [Conexibacter arvalis]
MIERIEPDGVFGLPDLVSQVSVVDGGRVAFLSGQLAWDESGAVVGKGSHQAQVEAIAGRIDRILAQLGADRSDIVKETIYVVDYRPELVPVILGALHGSPPPSSTLVGVAALADPDLLVEVECVVALPPA